MTSLTRRRALASGVLFLSMGASALSAQPKLPGQPKGDGSKPAQKKVEKHPHITAALHALTKATKELEEAAHDFGGHRKEALTAIKHAHRQLEACLKYDKA